MATFFTFSFPAHPPVASYALQARIVAAFDSTTEDNLRQLQAAYEQCAQVIHAATGAGHTAD